MPPKLIIALGKFIWTTQWQVMMANLAPANKIGNYQRLPSQFRQWINGKENDYGPGLDRYSLIVGLACPWAHRTMVVRALKGLERAMPMTIAIPDPEAGGWLLPEGNRWGVNSLLELYRLSQPGFSDRATVPVLYDHHSNTIVNNESSDIIVMLNRDFNPWANNMGLDLYPEHLVEEITQWNKKIYGAVNNGVYRCGFAQTQGAYDQACEELFEMLNYLDLTLGKQRFLCGDRLTLADIRLFTTLIRFDLVYYHLFKCNHRTIASYGHLGPYLQDLYQYPGVATTCDLNTIKHNYYSSLFPLNPGGIIPQGPDLLSWLNQPHDRSSI